MVTRWLAEHVRRCVGAMGIATVTIGMLLLVTTAASDAGAPPDTRDVQEARQNADEAVAKLTKTLMERLTAALAEGGPAQALRVCSEVAQDVTRDVGKEQELLVRRVSLRNRNPANVPNAFEQVWLESAEATLKAGKKPAPSYSVSERANGMMELRHLRPIMYPGGVCNACHGLPEEIPTEISSLLHEHYPEDRATGFRAGQLRGAISVTVNLPQTPEN